MNEKGRYMGTPELVIEILSPGTRSKDMVDKLNTYMLSGVIEYWIVDPGEKTLLLYNFKKCEVDEFITYKENETLTSCFFKGLRIDIYELFMP